MMDLKRDLYREFFLKLNRGNYRGNFSNAKPLFLLAVLDAIPNILSSNIISLDNKYFVLFYFLQFKLYEQDKATPIEKPYYHLDNEPFYSLVWQNKSSLTFKSTPSAKYIRENIAYAKLDDELWELLQNHENREYLKKEIINRYLGNIYGN